MSFLIFFFVIFLMVAIFGTLWAWTTYLDDAKPQGIRTTLYITLLVVTVVEFSLWYFELTKSWHIIPMTLCNIWGMYDAIARYPVVHDVDSFFTLKEIVIVAGKTIGYSVGFRNIGRMAGWFLLCLFVNVWFLPLMYLMALPIGDVQLQHAKSDVTDEDVIVRILNFRRKECRLIYIRKLIRIWESVAVFFGRLIPPLRQRMEQDTKYRRLLRKGPQV
eukprot:GEMP01021176.1.p1 GENE.GEMP01021176.1~~GEMP01021176.1.p1  ORF type:complete len:218 (+),score=21.96 GEMP01021176.1:83-736(+)